MSATISTDHPVSATSERATSGEPVPGEPVAGDGRRLELAGGEHLSYDLLVPATGVDTCVLYLHGFASRRDGEKAAFFRDRFVEAGLAFCRYDCRGHGDSGGRMLDLTLSRNLDDLEAMHAHLVERLRTPEGGAMRFVLFGSSMGGGTSLWYAARRAERSSVAAVLALAPAIELEDGLLRAVGAEAVEAWEREGTTLFRHELGDHELGWSLIEDLRSYDLSEMLRGYSTPTLIFQGMRDDSVDWRAVTALAEAGHRPDGTPCPIELQLFADGDHRLIDRLDALWDQSESFLRRRGLLPPADRPRGSLDDA
ncbi:MAG: alpha/beta fold hydrolase [Acidobacteriota bacterium]